MHNVYYESRSKSILFAGIIFALLFGLSFHQIYGRDGFWQIIIGWSITAAILILVSVIRSHGRLELFEEHFVYKKGRHFISSPWSEVKFVAFQRDASRFGFLGTSPSSAFFIDTNSGITKLIDTRILRLESGKRVNREELIQEIEKLAGKSMVLGDISTRQYVFWAH